LDLSLFIYLYTKADRYKLPGPTARSQIRTQTNHFSVMQNNIQIPKCTKGEQPEKKNSLNAAIVKLKTQFFLSQFQDNLSLKLF